MAPKGRRHWTLPQTKRSPLTPAYPQVRSSLNSRRATLVEEMNGMRPDHPIYQKDKEEIASIDGQMNDLRRNAAQHLQEGLRQDVTRTRMVELQLIRELGEKTHAATDGCTRFQRAAELGPEIDSLQKAYDAIDDRIRELELESNSPGSIHVSTKALTPTGSGKEQIANLLARAGSHESDLRRCGSRWDRSGRQTESTRPKIFKGL